MRLSNKIWRLWAKALGDKSGKNDREADFVAVIRTLIFIQLVVTNCFIIAGNIRHWNDNVPTEGLPKQYQSKQAEPNRPRSSGGEEVSSIYR